MTDFRCRIVTPLGVYKEFVTDIINIETTDGQRGILANHMPIVTMMNIGKMTTDIDGVREEFAVAGGLFTFRDNLAEIFTDAIENKKDIDEKRAQEALDRAEKRMKSADPEIDMKRAAVALSKALNRLKVKGTIH